MSYSVYIEAEVAGNSQHARDQISDAWNRALTGSGAKNDDLVAGTLAAKASLENGLESQFSIHTSFHVAQFENLGNALDFQTALRTQPEIQGLGLHPDICKF